jgi:hypothetical protein
MGVMSAGKLVMASVIVGVLPELITVSVADALALPPMLVQLSTSTYVPAEPCVIVCVPLAG